MTICVCIEFLRTTAAADGHGHDLHELSARGFVGACERTPRQAQGSFRRRCDLRDLAAIRGGIEFRRFIPETLAKCSVLLALIGPRWLIDKDGRPRLEQEGDLVRAEIAQALQQEGMLVIRVLVGGVRMLWNRACLWISPRSVGGMLSS